MVRLAVGARAVKVGDDRRDPNGIETHAGEGAGCQSDSLETNCGGTYFWI
jgi:hypothetical protein